MHMRLAKEAIRKATGRVNAPLEYWGCTNSIRYDSYRFHTYRNFPNYMDPDTADCVKWSIKEYAQCNSSIGGIRRY